MSKTLKFDSADFPEVVGKTEGMALTNDDDFGITGSRTQIVVLRASDVGRR